MRNFLTPFKKSPLFLGTYIFFVCVLTILWWIFTDIGLMLGNYGVTHTYLDIGLSMAMVFGFPLFIVGVAYKGLEFGIRENLNTRTGIGTLGGTLSIILSGCTCCGITLASYLGLLPLITLLPYEGLEIKAVGTIGLLYALWYTYISLETCQRRE